MKTLLLALSATLLLAACYNPPAPGPSGPAPAEPVDPPQLPEPVG